MRSIGLGMTLGMLLRLGSSLEVSWLVILGQEVRFGEVLDLQHSQRQSTSSCGVRHRSECFQLRFGQGRY